MNLGIESETLKFNKMTGEIEKAGNSIASMLNEYGHGPLFSAYEYADHSSKG